MEDSFGNSDPHLGNDPAPAAITPLGAADNNKTSFISPEIITSCVRGLEFGFLLTAGLMIALYYLGLSLAGTTLNYSLTITIMVSGYVVILSLAGGYRLNQILHPVNCLSTALLAWTSVFAIATLGMFIFKTMDSYSRVWLGSWFLAGCVLLVLLRISCSLIVHRLNKNGQMNRRALLIGGGAPAQLLLQALLSSPDANINILGIFDERDDDRAPGGYFGVEKLGKIDELIEYVRNSRVDLLLITLPLNAEDRLLKIIKRVSILPVDIRLCAYNQKLRYQSRAYSYIGNVPFFDVFDKPLTEWNKIVKFLEDKIIASLFLVFLSPLMLVIALLIKLGSKGPVIFRQTRYGFNNELISVYKFRTMYADKTDADAEKLTTRHDARVTPIGRFLRRSSLDELPQFFNVLNGSLSLVGPRPHATKAKAAQQLYTEVVESYFARHKMKPGITGWAQINGWRGETDTLEKLERRVEHDIYYIENWSLFFDLYILCKTPLVLLKGENAY